MVGKNVLSPIPYLTAARALKGYQLPVVIGWVAK